MATTGVNFVLINNAGGLNSATFTAIPFVDTYEHQSAILLSARNPGGLSYLQPSWVINKNIILLDDLMTRFDKDGAAKHGCFHVTTSGTTGVNIDLTNLATNATSSAGDATFATWYQIIFFNLSGLDGVAAADMTVAPGGSNPARMQLGGTSPTLTVAASSPQVISSKAGLAVDSTHKIITVTPSAGGNFAMLVSGA